MRACADRGSGIRVNGGKTMFNCTLTITLGHQKEVHVFDTIQGALEQIEFYTKNCRYLPDSFHITILQ